MFGLFAASCPLSTNEKVWVERRMRWFADQFGIDRMRNARVILPTDEFFPDRYEADEASARKCLDRMCAYMSIDPATITLEVLEDDQMIGAVGTYEMREQSNICIAMSQLGYPDQLMSTLAHELAHELLLKIKRLSPDTSDHEQMTDLLPVFLGSGIFIANATVVVTSGEMGTLHFWHETKHGYLNSITLGYALALFAFVRGERRPAWAKYLRTDALATFRQGLRYLNNTGDSLFHPDTIDKKAKTPTPKSVAMSLCHNRPTIRLSALRDIIEYRMESIELLPLVEQCFKDPDSDVQYVAVAALAVFGASAERTIPVLIQAAMQGSAEVRAAAAAALGDIGTCPSEVVSALGVILGDLEVNVVAAAATALAKYGEAATPALPRLLAAIELAASVTHDDLLSYLVAALQIIHPNARRAIRDHLQGRDPEGLRLALSLLREQRGEV